MWAENTRTLTIFYDYVWSEYFGFIYFISSQSPFQGYSNTLPPEMEMTPLFLTHSLQQPKGRCTSPAETSNSCLPIFPLSALSASVWPPLSYTHTHTLISLWATVGVWAQKEHEKRKEIKQERDEMWARWSHYSSRLMRVSVRDIAAGGHTMKSPHNCSLQSFLKLPFTNPNQLWSWFTAKLNKGVNFNDKSKSIYFKFL